MCSTILLHTQTMQSHDPQFPAPLVSNGNGSGNGNDSSSVSANPHNASRGMQGLRVLVCLASYDFGQFPLLEEVLDSYQDFCVAGASIDVYIHTAIPYTVGLIDMLNARLSCEGMQIIIAVQSPAVRLNLVDRHRQLFYEKIDDYDLFIYSEVSSKFCAFHSLFMHSLVFALLKYTFHLMQSTSYVYCRMISKCHPQPLTHIYKKQSKWSNSSERVQLKIITSAS